MGKKSSWYQDKGQLEQLAQRVCQAAPVIPGYDSLREIHRGGQGVVYAALQRSTGRKVAIKVMREGWLARPADRARFDREVRILARLRHPNIVAIHDSGTVGQDQYFVMDHIEGDRLDRYLERLPTPRDRQAAISMHLRLAAKICEAVHAAHLSGVTHRDLKPGNILVDTDGEPYILDFGLAKATETEWQSRKISVTGEFFGSLPWTSPEQAEGATGTVDTRADVYSLGVILFEMLTGQFPYPVTGNMRDVLDNVIRAEPARPSAAQRHLSSDIDTIVLKSLAKDRQRRYQNAGELARDIRHYLAGEPIEAKRDSSLYVLRKQLYRHRVVAGAALTVLVVLAAALVVTTTMYFRAASDRERADWQAYLANIGAAESALRLNDVVTARERLKEQIPEEFHGNWEWRLLWNQLDQSVATLIGHEDGVIDLAVGPDGTWVASASSDSTVRLWDIESRKQLLRALRGHSAGVCSIAISPDGAIVASGSGDHTVKLWDASTGQEIRTLLGPEWPIGCLAFSPDGRRLAAGWQTSASGQGRVTVWDVATGRVLAEWQADRWTVESIVFTHDGAQIITGGEEGVVRFWSSTTGLEIRDSIRCGKSRTGAVLSVALSNAGDRLATGCRAGVLDVWDLNTGQKFHTCTGHSQEVLSVAFSPDDRLLASASADRTIRLWNVAAGREVALLVGHTGHVTSLGFCLDGSHLVSGSSDGTLRLWDMSRTERVPTLRGHVGHDYSTIQDVAISPDGSILATASTDGTVKLWNLSTFEEEETLDHGVEVRSVEFLPQGKRLVTSTLDGQVHIWHAAGLREKGAGFSVHREGERPIGRIDLSSDGEMIASANGTTARLWSLRTGEERHLSANEHDGFVHNVAFSPDQKWLISASADGKVRLWSVESGQRQHLLQGHAESVYGVAFHPNEPIIASGSSDRSVRLWRVDTGEPLMTLDHSDQVNRVAFAPDGLRLACAGQDHTITLWDVKTGHVVLVLRGHHAPVTSLAFSHDGDLLVSGDQRGEVRLWFAVEPSHRAIDVDRERSSDP